MEYIVGLVLAVGVGIFGTLVGFDRDRSFYPVVLVIIAALYLLFAAIGGSTSALTTELLQSTLFIIAAVVGFKWSPWIVVAGLAAHGVFDFFHALMINNPGVPVWWPGFCLGYDVAAAGFFGLLIRFRGVQGEY